ncbi:MAG: hypothetical protein HXS48_10150 [Theionarchaea archaeon]|nr:hypothetical protein [Theionarchaea archaeon]
MNVDYRTPVYIFLEKEPLIASKEELPRSQFLNDTKAIPINAGVENISLLNPLNQCENIKMNVQE